MSDVVISYARKDQEWREKLARCLRERSGLNVWSDERIQPGEEFSDAIDREIRNSKVVIVIWTPESITSSWVRAEALRARDLGKLIPVRIDTDSVGNGFEIPVPFNGIQTFDLSGWEGECGSATVGYLIHHIEIAIDSTGSRRPLDQNPLPPANSDAVGGIETPLGSRPVDEKLYQALTPAPILKHALAIAGLAAAVAGVLHGLGLSATTAVVVVSGVCAFMVALLALANLASRLRCRPSVYVSYAWKEEEQNRLVDKLEQACAARSIELLRDTKRVAYGDSIQQFMDQLGAGRHVVLVLSEAYFKSAYCMYELRQIHENREFRKRVHPVVLSGTQFRKPIDRIRYVKYWEEEITDLQAELAKLSDPKNTLRLRESLDDYADFRRLMDELQSDLADMNALTEDVHVATDFAALLDHIAPPRVVSMRPCWWLWRQYWRNHIKVTITVTVTLCAFIIVVPIAILFLEDRPPPSAISHRKPPCDPVTDLARPELARLIQAAEGYLANGQAQESVAAYRKVEDQACSATRDRVADVLGDRAARLLIADEFEAAARAYQEAFQAIASPQPPSPPRSENSTETPPAPIDRLSGIMVNGRLVTSAEQITVPPLGTITGVLEPAGSEPRTIVAIVSNGAVSDSFEVASNGGQWVIKNVRFRPPAKAVAETHVEISVRRRTDGKAVITAVFNFQLDVARPRILTHAVCRNPRDCPVTVILGTVENVMDQDEKLIIQVGRSITGVAAETSLCLLADVTGRSWRTAPIPRTDQGNVRVRLQKAGLVSISTTWANCSQPFEDVLIQ